MSKVVIELSTLTDIGNAVRAKKGTAEQIPVANLANEIQSIQGGTDTSADTVTAESMLEGVTAHNASGEPIVGVIPLYDGAVTGGLSVMANASKYLYGREATADETPTHTIDGVGYVGVVLPNIDEVWNKGTYPYAVMQCVPAFSALYMTSVPLIRDENSKLVPRENGIAKIFAYGNDQESAEALGIPLGEWSSFGEMEIDRENTNLGVIDNYLWVSHDILNTDGSVYLAATEPIPIYE